MRIVLPSGTPAEIDQSAVNPSMGLVIIPDIFGLRPLFEEMVAKLAKEWNMAVIAFEPFPGRTFSDDVAERFAAMSQLDDDVIFRDAMQAADALGVAICHAHAGVGMATLSGLAPELARKGLRIRGGRLVG